MKLLNLNNLGKTDLSWDLLRPLTYNQRNRNSLHLNSGLATLMEDWIEETGFFSALVCGYLLG